MESLERMAEIVKDACPQMSEKNRYLIAKAFYEAGYRLPSTAEKISPCEIPHAAYDKHFTLPDKPSTAKEVELRLCGGLQIGDELVEDAGYYFLTDKAREMFADRILPLFQPSTANREAVAEEYAEELRIGSILTAKLTDKCRELELKLSAQAEEI